MTQITMAVGGAGKEWKDELFVVRKGGNVEDEGFVDPFDNQDLTKSC